MFRLLSKLKDPLKRMRFILYIGAVLIVIIIISGGAVYLTFTPQFCSICHSMRSNVAAWEKSTHTNVTCYECHGYKGAIDWLYQNLTEIYLELSGNYEKPINNQSRLSKEMPSEVCDYCHEMRERTVTPSKGVLINHKKHEEKGIKCSVCHNRVAHKGVGKTAVKNDIYPDRMKMRYCMKCHTGGKGRLTGSRDCRTCHPEDFELKPKNHLVVGFLKPVDEKTSALHARGAKLDREYCLSCHQERFCPDCHGVEMPHPKKDWAKGEQKHAALGKERPGSCGKCHPQTNFCFACHHPDWKPDAGPWWGTVPGPSQHARVAKAKGEKVCFKKCHSTVFCDHCHVTGEKLKE